MNCYEKPGGWYGTRQTMITTLLSPYRGTREKKWYLILSRLATNHCRGINVHSYTYNEYIPNVLLILSCLNLYPSEINSHYLLFLLPNGDRCMLLSQLMYKVTIIIHFIIILLLNSKYTYYGRTGPRIAMLV